MSWKLFYRYWNPQQVKEVNHVMIRLEPWYKLLYLISSKNWPQGHENKPALEWKTNCTWNNQDDTDQINTWPISRWLSELTVLLWMNSLLSSIWSWSYTLIALDPWAGHWFCGTWVHLLLGTVTSSIKLPFLSLNTCNTRLSVLDTWVMSGQTWVGWH